MKISINKNIVEKLKIELLGSWDCVDNAIMEMRRYKKEFPHEDGYNIYAYGNIFPYYSQIREFLADDCGAKISKNDNVMQKFFEKHIEVAVDCLLADDKYKNIKTYKG